MADRVEGPEFLLPSEFLTDEDFLTEKENFKKKNEPVPEFCFPTEFPYDFGSYAVGSPNTESDDEDLLAAFTRSSFHPSHRKHNPAKTPNLEKGRMMSGSPQSTLTQVGSWSGLSSGGSKTGSPNAPSLVPSPPATPYGIDNKPWDLIYEPAVQVPTRKVNGGDGFAAIKHAGLPGPPRSLAQLQYPSKSPYTPVFINTRFQQVTVEHLMNHQNIGRGMWYGQQQVHQNGIGRVGAGMGQVAHQTRPTHKSSMPGTRAASFGGYGGGDRAGPGGGGVKRACAGTGVFLPRRYGNIHDKNAFPSDSRKKLVSSTSLLPDKVLDALNKNFIDMNYHAQSPPRFNTSFLSDCDTLMARRNALLVQHQFSLRSSAHGVYPPKDWSN